MGQENTINLIEEISEKQKNNDYIIFTTFRFDPYLFDNYLFNKLRMNNPTAEIIVLLDAGQYEETYEKFTRITGCNYHLVPIFLKIGVFHPKIFVFISSDNKKATVYIGSANLTTSGFTRNAEIVTKIDFRENNWDSFWIDLQGFFNGLIDSDFIVEKKVKEILQVTSKKIIQPENSIPSGDCQLIHNLTVPILHQVLQQIGDKNFSEITAFAPFFSKDALVMKTICDRVNVQTFRLVLQKNNHNLHDLKPYLDFFSSKSIPCQVCEIEYPNDENRKFHSKLIYFSGAEKFLLVGSPNITQRALLSNAENGNIECGLLIKGNRAKNVLKQIIFFESRNPDDLVKSGSPMVADETESLLKIYSVDFNDEKGNLNVKTEIIPEEATVDLYLEKQSEPVSHKINLKDGEFNLPKILNGIPIQIIIKSQNKLGKRRIFYERSYYFRTIASDPESLQKIAERFSFDCSLDQSDINAIIIGLVKQPQKPDVATIMGSNDNQTVKNSQNINARPSSVRPSVSHMRSVLKELDQLTRLIEYQKKQENLISHGDDEEGYENGIAEDEKTNKPVPSEKKEIIRFINAIDRMFQLILIEKNTKDINVFVDSQTSLLGIILRRISNFIEISHIGLIEEILEKNFSNVKLEKCSKKSSVNLFKQLLVINYCYNYQLYPRFMREIFYCHDFFTSEVYEEIKKFVFDFSVQYLPDRMTFNQKEFLESFGNMLSFTFDSKTITLGPLEVVQKLIETEDTELIEYYGIILKKLKYGPYKGGGSMFSLNSPRKKISEYIENLTNIDQQKQDTIKDFLGEGRRKNNYFY